MKCKFDTFQYHILCILHSVSEYQRKEKPKITFGKFHHADPGGRAFWDWACGLLLLGLRVRIPPGTWMSVTCDCCVLSGRGLCVGPITRPEVFYQVSGCDREASPVRKPRPTRTVEQWKQNYVFFSVSYGRNARPSLMKEEVEMGPIGCPETSVRNYHYSVHKSPEDRSSRVQTNLRAVNSFT
jgi:hypothetical protein